MEGRDGVCFLGVGVHSFRLSAIAVSETGVMTHALICTVSFVVMYNISELWAVFSFVWCYGAILKRMRAVCRWMSSEHAPGISNDLLYRVDRWRSSTYWIERSLTRSIDTR